MAVEEQQALISEKLLNGANQSVQTEPHLPVGCQEIGQEKLFVVAKSSAGTRLLKALAGGGGPYGVQRC